MTYQSNQAETLPTKPLAPTEQPLFTEAELLEGDRYNNRTKQLDPFRQAEADRWLGREGRSA